MHNTIAVQADQSQTVASGLPTALAQSHVQSPLTRSGPWSPFELIVSVTVANGLYHEPSEMR